MIKSRTILIAAALAGAASVALGAFGAHALRATLDEPAPATWRTAIDYAFWHALALLGTAALARDGVTRALAVAAIAFVVGIVLFSGSLCALALGAPRAVGIVTPFGGVGFIVGWLALGIEGWRRR
jgi:uncharacterized membrane protein YgdD (TMEM256/DUF423 family)